MEHNAYKEIAKAFLLNSAQGNPRPYFEKYTHPDFKHHNVFFKGDAQTLLKAIEENGKANPHKIFTIHHALQDENLVAIHSHVQQNPNDSGAAVIHIFKFVEDKIIEVWDFGQAVPAEMVNENGMF